MSNTKSNTYSVTYSGSDFLEITPGGVHKGEVLAAFYTQLDAADLGQEEMIQ
jgi:hydroxymethylpyrimidine pyrophosphatase-like HAD family hydrolase